MMTAEEYRAQIEKQLREYGLADWQVRLTLDTATGYAAARYADGFEDGAADRERRARESLPPGTRVFTWVEPDAPQRPELEGPR